MGYGQTGTNCPTSQSPFHRGQARIRYVSGAYEVTYTISNLPAESLGAR